MMHTDPRCWTTNVSESMQDKHKKNRCPTSSREQLCIINWNWIMQLQAFTFCAGFLSFLFLCVVYFGHGTVLTSLFLHHSIDSIDCLVFMRKQRESILVFHFAEKKSYWIVRFDIESAFYINTFSYVKLPVIASEQLSYETNRKGSFSCELFLCAPISWRDLAIDWKPCRNKYSF